MMIVLNKLINFGVLVLFITNLWVFAYTNIIVIFNFLYPPVVKQQFYRPAAAWPEAFEMPVYLVLTFLFVIIIWFLMRHTLVISSLVNKMTLKIFLFLFLLLAFLTKLGAYPMANEHYPYELRPDQSIYLIILFLYLSFIGFFTFQALIFNKIFAKNSRFKLLFYLIVGLVIAIVTLEPSFPISAHEYGYFFGPVWEIITGKTIFTHFHTDYGFYATLFFAGLYKLGLFQFNQLPIYVWLMFIIQYFLCFYLIYKISKSVTLALIGLFSIITINYFSFFVLPITITQYSAMRRLPSVFLIFLLYKFRKFDTRLLLATALIDFWIVDVGISILLASGLTLVIQFLAKQINLGRLIKLVFQLAVFQITVFILINLVHLLLGYGAINPMDILNSLSQHAGSGLTMLPIEQQNYFWFVILIYFASVIYYFKKSPKEQGENPTQLLLFSTNLSLLNALYFVGRSHAANLFDISVLVLLNLFIFLALLWERLKSDKIRVIIAIFLFLFLIVIPAFYRRFTLSEFILEKYKGLNRAHRFNSQTTKLWNDQFKDEITLIKNNIVDEEVLILSREETYLLILSNKHNLLSVNPQSGIDTHSEMDFAVKKASIVCPEKIAVDCRIFKKCPDYESYSQKSLFMAPHILEKIEHNCQVKYQPVICTNKLCITKSIKQ